MPNATNPIVTGLPAYVQQNRDMLLKNFALAGPGTRARIGLQTGIKRKAALNYTAIEAVFQEASDCGFNPSGSITHSQREIEVATIAYMDTYCPKKLLGKYPEYLVSVNARPEGKELPFEGFLTDAIIAEINKGIEALIWRGNKTSGTGNLALIDGFLAIAADEADVIDVAIAAGTSAYDAVKAVYMALPEETLDRGAEIYVSPAFYRTFMQELVEKNFFHYSGAQDAAPSEFVFPGTDVKVVKTYGLKGTLNILGTFPKNLIYGTDMENDEEEIYIKYDELNEKFNMKAQWNSGVQIAYPDMVVLATLAAAPVSPNGNAAALAAIAANTETIADAMAGEGQFGAAVVDSLQGIQTATETLANPDTVFKTQEQGGGQQ